MNYTIFSVHLISLNMIIKHKKMLIIILIRCTCCVPVVLLRVKTCCVEMQHVSMYEFHVLIPIKFVDHRKNVCK